MDALLELGKAGVHAAPSGMHLLHPARGEQQVQGSRVGLSLRHCFPPQLQGLQDGGGISFEILETATYLLAQHNAAQHRSIR